jgi:hypothetical protein
MAYTGQLYQLYSNKYLPFNSYVAVNGPWDTYGITRGCTQEPDGRWLNVVRGTPKQITEKPIYQF